MIKSRYFFTSSVLFLAILAIAIFSNFTVDESLTHYNILQSSIRGIIDYTEFRIANNHLFNSIWVWLVHQVEPKDPFYYRIVSLGSFALHLLYVHRLLRVECGDNYKSLYFLPLLLLPYTCFFAMARGYAMAIGFFTMSLYYFRRCILIKQEIIDGTPHCKYLLLFLVGGVVSSLSVFSFFYPFVATCILLFFEVYVPAIRRQGGSFKVFGPLVLAAVIVLPLLFYIQYAGTTITKYDSDIIGLPALFKGGMFSSIITFLALENLFPANVHTIVKAAIVLTMVPAIFAMLRMGKMYYEIRIFLVTVVLLVISHYVLGSLYPIIRSVSFLILLIYLPLTYAAMQRRSIFIRSHLILVGVLGAIQLLVIVNGLRYKDVKDAIADTAVARDTLFTNYQNPNMRTYNYLYCDNKQPIVILHDTVIMKQVNTMNYVYLYPPLTLDNNPDFEVRYEMVKGKFYVRKTK